MDPPAPFDILQDLHKELLKREPEGASDTSILDKLLFKYWLTSRDGNFQEQLVLLSMFAGNFSSEQAETLLGNSAASVYCTLQVRGRLGLA